MVATLAGTETVLIITTLRGPSIFPRGLGEGDSRVGVGHKD